MKTINEIQQRIDEEKYTGNEIVRYSCLDESRDTILKTIEEEIETELKNHQYSSRLYKTYYIHCPQHKGKEIVFLQSIIKDLEAAGYKNNGCELRWCEKINSYRITIDILLYPFNETEIKELNRLQQIRDKILRNFATVILLIFIISILYVFPNTRSLLAFIVPIALSIIFFIMEKIVATKEKSVVNERRNP